LNIFIQPVSCRSSVEFLEDNLSSWGVKRGKNDINRKKFDKMNLEDIVLFYQTKTLFARVKVTKKEFNEDEEFECRYFFDKADEISIAIEDFNNIVGYKSSYIPQGFLRLDDKKSKAFIESKLF
jgi:hypothetical protein